MRCTKFTNASNPFQVRTEQVGFSRLLEPIIRTEAVRRKQYLPLVWIDRDTREAKQARIAGIQPWLERGEIHIVSDILHREDLVLELVRFPKYRRDDIVGRAFRSLENGFHVSGFDGRTAAGADRGLRRPAIRFHGMNRRSFFRTMIGGVATAAAVRTFPFRVFSFPAEIAPTAFPVLLAPNLSNLSTIYYSKEAIRTLEKNLRFSSVKLYNGNNFYAVVHPMRFKRYQKFLA